MKSDVIRISSTGRCMENAMREAEKVAAYKGLSHKGALHLRLLMEEMMGMMRSITGETEGDFWIEDKDGLYQLHLKVETAMTMEKREELLAASTTGKNESARGFMGRLRDFFDRSADCYVSIASSPVMMSGMLDGGGTDVDLEWSMLAYQDAVEQMAGRNEGEARELWDELEKSVVAHVADDVKVSIRGGTAEMIILKKLA